MKSVSIGHFHHYMYMGANFRHSSTSNIEGNILIWPKFELIREFMAVLATCKFDEDPIKIEGRHYRLDKVKYGLFQLARASKS